MNVLLCINDGSVVMNLLRSFWKPKGRFKALSAQMVCPSVRKSLYCVISKSHSWEGDRGLSRGGWGDRPWPSEALLTLHTGAASPSPCATGALLGGGEGREVSPTEVIEVSIRLTQKFFFLSPFRLAVMPELSKVANSWGPSLTGFLVLGPREEP